MAFYNLKISCFDTVHYCNYLNSLIFYQIFALSKLGFQILKGFVCRQLPLSLTKPTFLWYQKNILLTNYNNLFSVLSCLFHKSDFNSWNVLSHSETYEIVLTHEIWQWQAGKRVAGLSSPFHTRFPNYGRIVPSPCGYLR